MSALVGLRKQFGINKKTASFLMAFSVFFNLGLSAAPLAMAVSQPTAKVSFTFDDALTSSLTQAAPTLAKYGFSGTNYVPTGCVGSTGSCGAEPTASYMTWDQVLQLKNNYGWEIASHTVSHPLLASTDPTSQPVALTPAQVDSELTTSKLTLSANGIDATDFATPYGDWTPSVLAQIAKVYGSHRGFADSIDQTGPALVPDGVIDHGNTYPYNDYLIYDYQVQAGVTVAQVENIINQTKASNQWLVLTFHDISPTASTNPDDYQYNTADLDAIAAYVKAQGIQVVNINGGLVTNAANLLANSSFDSPISSNTADTTAWSTDNPTNIKQDTASNGNYPSATNSVSLTGTTVDAHLFSPRVPVDPSKAYVLKNFLNVTNMAVAAGHEIAFYIDEYNTSGAYLGATARYMKSEVGNAGNATGAWVESLNFQYTPTAGAATARLQVVVTANSGAKVYLDNVQWFAQDGSTVAGQGAVTPPVTTAGGSGDLDGNGIVNGHDLSILLSNWGKPGATAAKGDLDANGIVNGHDLSILLTHWTK